MPRENLSIARVLRADVYDKQIVRPTLSLDEQRLALVSMSWLQTWLEFRSWRIRKLWQFSLASLLLLMALVCLYLAVQRNRQVAAAAAAAAEVATRQTYDAQKRVVEETKADFVKQLKSEGWTVSDESGSLAGSGEWRATIALNCKKPDSPQQLCYVEVMGIVSHDDNDSPDWQSMLPMHIAYEDQALDQRFLDLLLPKIESHAWEYRRESFHHPKHVPGKYRKTSPSSPSSRRLSNASPGCILPMNAPQRGG